jgi:SPX domain protein involved in polyphosphate accumulation
VDAASSLPSFGEQADVCDSGIVSSVYYDNPEQFNSYHTRLRKEDFATAVRVRW